MSARLVPAALLLTVVVGCAGSVEGQGGFLGAGPPVTSTTSESTPPETTSPETTSSEATTEPTTTASPPTTSAPPPTTSGPAPPPPPPPTSGGQLSDDEWVVDSFEYSGSVIGLFDGTARITNAASTQRSAIYTFTLFDGETLVASMIGSSSEVASGDTVTVSMISGDDFVEGEFSVDFQVDLSS